ncbi:MAG: hypothetical protein RDU89_10210 [bacterium]|nr:hypothetical protein [bacterium]
MIYTAAAGFFWVLGLLVVPPDHFRRLLPFGVLAGFALAAAVNLLGSPVLGLWSFARTGWLTVQGVPLMALLAWIPLVIAFVHYLPEAALQRLGWLLLFPLGFTGHQILFLRLGARAYAPGWSLPHDFTLSLTLHLLILAAYLLVTGRDARPADR